jgi:fructose-1,6-bisphosphatase I
MEKQGGAMRQVTVTEHLLVNQRESDMATGRFTRLLNEIILSAKLISRDVTKAGLLNIQGKTGEVNIQGEEVRKMDDYANRVLIHRMERAGVLCAMVSEENADLIEIPDNFPVGDYFLAFDPLDGSANIDANVSIGTIFGIYRRKGGIGRNVTLGEVLQKGAEQIAAGYVIYGSSTMLVYTAGNGVNGFTLDPSVGEFLLSHPNIRIPEQGKIYSVNEGYWDFWDDATKEAVQYFKTTGNHNEKIYSLRYIGSLVSDFHRNLLYGGIFLYPRDNRDPKKSRGKLRYLVEAAPMAMIVEQAGGMAIDGYRRILDIEPEEIHDRVPLIVGSKNEVLKVQEIYAKHAGASK